MNEVHYAGLKLKMESSLKTSFPALFHKNFRYFWIGQCISLIGTWMQNAGQAWIVLKFTNNSFLLGLLNAAQFVPMLVLSLFAGVIVDRFPKRKVIIITQILMMLCAFALTLLIWTNRVKYIFIIIIAVILGIAQSIDMPARQSFMVELVGKEDLLNAIALNSSIFNAARVIGPALAGIVMGWIGAEAAFFINGVSFIAVIYGLYKIKVEDKCSSQISDKSMIQNAVEGIKYILRTPILYMTMILVAVIWTFCLNFGTIIPAFAKDVLKQQEIGYGLLMSSMGIGATIGALSLATKSRMGAKFTVLLTGGGILSVFITIIGLQKNYILSAMLLAVAGWGMVIFSASANSILQINSPDNMRGRIMSVFALVSGGVVPFGSLYAGYISQDFGANYAFFISGIIGICTIALAAVMFHIRNKSANI